MTTIKFPRPDGEARLEWIEVEAHSDGGYVRLRIGDEHWSYDGAFDGLGLGLVAYVGTVAAREILAEAEKLRNERRALAADGSEVVVAKGAK